MSGPPIAVVGAGPAGLMAAEVLAAAGLPVTVHDRMPSPGRKLLMAGRGGLNLTHTEPLEAFLDRYGPARPTLEPMIRAFDPDALRAWCEGLGQGTFVGSSGRVFPTAFKASPLLRAWLARLGTLGVSLHLGHRWTGWDGDALVLEGPDGPVRHPGPAVLALGGASWPRLGSDGAWVPVLERAGVGVAPLRPANVGVDVAWSAVFRERFAGTPLKRLSLSAAGRRVMGEAVVTRHGLEGGAVYALAADLREEVARSGTAGLALDLRTGASEAELAARLARARPGESLSNTLRKAGLPPVALGLVREAAGLSLPREPGALARLVKALPLAVTGTRGLDRAISTAGGVRLSEVDGRLMLKARPGTFVAGEMLDWEAPTGGYLLQASFATGAAAARGLLAWLREAQPE